LKLARQRLLAGSPIRALRSAAAQQGLMQIVRDFCEHTNAVCENCRFPELVGIHDLEIQIKTLPGNHSFGLPRADRAG